MLTESQSSNTEKVSELLPCPFCGQQDFLVERLDSDASVVICQGLTGPHEACLARGPVGVAQDEGEEQPGRDKAVELWNARAEQHRGEPVALPARKNPSAYPLPMDAARGYGWNACLDEIEKLGPLYTHPAPVQGEPVAWLNTATGAVTASPVQVMDWDDKSEPVQALYTHADPAEVEQLQGSLAIPEECPHLIVFDDTEVGSLMFSGSGARAAALKKWEAISTSWNANLFVRLARNSRDDRAPCATVADPGEVERLRAALKFYADRDHFAEDIGSDWDSVSGEPASILWHEDEAWFVEDGSIARAALERRPS